MQSFFLRSSTTSRFRSDKDLKTERERGGKAKVAGIKAHDLERRYIRQRCSGRVVVIRIRDTKVDVCLRKEPM